MMGRDLTPGWAKAFFFGWMLMLWLTTFVVVVNLWGAVNHIIYSLPGLIVFTVLSLGVIYVMTKCQQIAWSNEDYNS